MREQDPRLRFVLLGSEVVVESPAREVLRRARICYDALPAGSLDHGDERGVVLARVTPDARGFTVSVDGRRAGQAPDLVSAVRSLNHELMHAVMRRRPELFYVHAGVVAADRRALVLPGLSRAGKSTLVVALCAMGARFLSDELLVYDPETRTALPFPRAPKVRDECVGYFPELAAAFVGTGEGRFLPLDAFGTDIVADPATPRVVALPRYSQGGDDRPEPVTPGECLLHLAESALNFGSHRAASIEHLVALAEASTSYVLTWHEPRTAAARLLELLRRDPV